MFYSSRILDSLTLEYSHSCVNCGHLDYFDARAKNIEIVLNAPISSKQFIDHADETYFTLRHVIQSLKLIVRDPHRIVERVNVHLTILTRSFPIRNEDEWMDYELIANSGIVHFNLFPLIEFVDYFRHNLVFTRDE